MRSRRTVRVFAPAKINLTLHVTGRRADGYHLIDSLVAFADIGDWLTLDEAEGFRLEVIGTYGGRVPAGTENLVLRAAMAMGPGPGADILLEKELPVASGIGGGSADAAAAARGLAALRGGAVPAEALAALAALGADLPMCLASAPVRAEGIGERMTPLAGLPEAHLVLANPGRPVETAAAFARLDSRRNRPMPTDLPQMATVEALAEFLRGQRNDLEPAAEQLVPEIAEVRTALATRRGCLAARMSGSGATVFGLFAGEDAARAAQAALVGGGWWVAAGRLLADAGAAQPQLIRDTT